MSRRKIGLIGCGRWGTNILRDLLALGAEVIVCDPSADARNQAVAGGAAQAVGVLHELMPDLDGYVIASPASRHIESVVELLPRGRPIYVEKPLSSDTAQARSLATRPGALERVFVMHKWRFHPGVRRLEKLVAAQELGAVVGLRLQRTNWAEMHPDVDCALQLLPHDLSIVLHLLGGLPPVEVAIANPLGSSRVGLWASLYDPVRGLRVTLDVNNMIPGNVRSCVVGCEQGVAILTNSDPQQIAIHRFGSSVNETLEVAAEMPLLLELKAFLDHLGGGSPPHSGLVDELLILDHVDAIRRRIYAEGPHG